MKEYDRPGGQTIQFLGPAGPVDFQISAWPFKELTVHGQAYQLDPPSNADDQPDQLDTVRVFNDDTVQMTFSKNGISYVVETILPQNAPATADILKSWQFI